MDAHRLSALEKSHAVDLIEIFSSVQGEGPRVGERHLFVRTAHCDLKCVWCDTPLCHVVPREARVTPVNDGATECVPNPVPVAQVLGWISAALAAVPHAAVSFTGGEPLLHPWLIRAAAPLVRAAGVKVLLETDGTMPTVLEAVLDSVDIVSMDWKLPSSCGERNLDAEHAAFLRCAQGREVVVKLVMTASTTADEVAAVARCVARECPSAVLVLQPVTPLGGAVPPAPRALPGLQAIALREHALVRVLPQVHRLMGQA
ncbi:MAG: 7-carboxy-7-deazaguanine synthase QueE [Planctomycetes bacterium]|nr:7-carboxy-7-deazaguanine synthase QueE [Planctomycetota bacterium]